MCISTILLNKNVTCEHDSSTQVLSAYDAASQELKLRAKSLYDAVQNSQCLQVKPCNENRNKATFNEMKAGTFQTV